MNIIMFELLFKDYKHLLIVSMIDHLYIIYVQDKGMNVVVLDLIRQPWRI